MANYIPKRTPDSPDRGNTQVDGTAVHTNTLAERKADLEAEMRRAERADPSSGAPSRSPKSELLDTRDVALAHPDLHVRMVNIKSPDRAATRLREGYTEVPQNKGGRRVGDEYVMMSIPREVAERRIAAERRETQRRERAHIDQWKEMAEQAGSEVGRSLGINPQDLIFVDTMPRTR